MSQPRKAPSDGGGVVYSTGIGERCPNCQRPVRECVCKKGTPGKTTSDGIVRVSRETAGRKGKGVTVIAGLGLPPDQLAGPRDRAQEEVRLGRRGRERPHRDPGRPSRQTGSRADDARLQSQARRRLDSSIQPLPQSQPQWRLA